MNNIIERTQTAAESRKAKAETHLKQLRTERETVLSRQKAAEETIERLNDDITRATRSGEADVLAALRSDRREAEESVQDLARALPGLDREIELATGEAHMAERACQASAWNKIQIEQAQLIKTVEESVNMIVDAIAEKERLAHRQLALLSSVCPDHNRNADAIRHEISHAIAERLQGRPATGLRLIDWSSWPMSEQGDLLR